MLTINDTLDGFLHDLEIKGNSIIDSTTSEVKSVGDKLGEQDLYKITLLSTNDLDSSDSNYKKYELEILSPVQLEKVGDKCDRIICNSDNLWVVEKNVRAVIEDGVLVNKQAQPETILLSLSQRIALRTFADRTHISFDTEIQPTIKAQVPKSLGATVNTHTTQIDNLNKELDRVKKLEESTVSTVTSDKAFTTVSETTQGYFEDVRIEGKTLVNLCPNKPYESVGNGSSAVGIRRKLLKNIEGGKPYTICYTVSPDTDATSIIFAFYSDSGNRNGDIYVGNISKFSGTTQVKLIERTSTLENANLGCYIAPASPNGSKCHIHSIVILEGDHTDKDISYFEGLKSVGQDVDEISVESISNGNLINEFILSDKHAIKNDLGVEVTDQTSRYTQNYISVAPNVEYTLRSKAGQRIYFYDVDKNWISRTIVHNNLDIDFKTPSNCRYIQIQYHTDRLISGNWFILNFKGDTSEGQHRSNKKQILYFNPTTQTWEKPVLREWDSIEKHSDGKYYYHKRSGEIVLNGSESGIWCMDNHSFQSETTTLYGIPLPNFDGKVNISNSISSSFRCGDVWLRDDEIFQLHEQDRIDIRILKSKLSTQDVAGFKQWLQANNVTVVYQLAKEEIYECTNLDLITYSGETNLIVNSGAIQPKLELKVLSNVSNVVKLLQEKVSVLENNTSSYIVTQNRLQLASTYAADSVTFKVDYASAFDNRSVDGYNPDLYNLILSNILVGKDNYDYDKMFSIILDYASWDQISWEQFDELVLLMDIQHNPPIEIPEEDYTEEEIPEI